MRVNPAAKCLLREADGPREREVVIGEAGSQCRCDDDRDEQLLRHRTRESLGDHEVGAERQVRPVLLESARRDQADGIGLGAERFGFRPPELLHRDMGHPATVPPSSLNGSRIVGEVLRFRAPGRVNLIGDHTDYNDGFVLPIAIDRQCVVSARPAATVRVESVELGETIELPADGGDVEGIDRVWGRLVAAVAQELSALGRPPVGMDAVVTSDVPIGAGLSSSAAFEVACAVSLAGIAGWDADRAALALACRNAEERATGVPCGVMDQLIALTGEEGCAQLIDCRTLETKAVRLPERMTVLVVHSGQANARGERLRGAPPRLRGAVVEDRRSRAQGRDACPGRRRAAG